LNSTQTYKATTARKGFMLYMMMAQNSNSFSSPKRSSSKTYTPHQQRSMKVPPRRYRTSYLEEEHKDDNSNSLSAPERDRRDLFHRAAARSQHGTLLNDIVESDEVIKGKSFGLATRSGGLVPRAASEAQVGAQQTKYHRLSTHHPLLNQDAVKARIMREYHELTLGRGGKPAPELSSNNEKICSRNMLYSGLLQELQEMMGRSQDG
jgi:hypothetical protein